MGQENKVVFGLTNAHYARITEEAGVITYGTPKRLPGAVELSLTPRGDMVEFFADNMVFYAASNNQGYDGSLSIANFTEEFLTEILGEVKHEVDGVITEVASAKGSTFALMFEFDGDVKGTRHVLYNCSASRPTVSGSTKTNSAEPKPNELSFIASPRAKDDFVKTKTGATTPDAVYNAWYTKVFEQSPVEAPAGA